MSNRIVNAFKHFAKVCVHKHWVFYYCCKAGIPLQGLTHDLSKFMNMLCKCENSKTVFEQIKKEGK